MDYLTYCQCVKFSGVECSSNRSVISVLDVELKLLADFVGTKALYKPLFFVSLLVVSIYCALFPNHQLRG